MPIAGPEAGGRRRLRRACGALVAVLLCACANDEPVPVRSMMSPAQARELIARLLPAGVADRPGWAGDIHAALSTLQLGTTVANICSVIAVIEQESSFRANPTVPGLPAIAWREIDAKAERAGVPAMLVHAALRLPSPDGRSYSERIDAARTERDLNDLFEDFIGMVPMGKRLFAGLNPVRTAGPMQVSIAFSESQAQLRPYPYPVNASLRAEVFSRRGGVYFGTAHLLDYPAAYDRPLYRFADFNAGRYASRNAAFQNAVALTTGVTLALDGDLIDHGPGAKDRAGATELATRVLGARLGMSNEAVRSALEQEKTAPFSRTSLFLRVFELADQTQGRPVPRAMLPRIQLKSPKITRDLSTEWFATRVDERHQRCVTRAAQTAPVVTPSLLER